MLKRLLCVSVVALALTGCKQYPESHVQPKPAGIVEGQIGSALPDFLVTDLDGREISSADLRGKVVLIDFWATWCQPCAKEMPGYQRLFDQYGSRGLVVIGLKATMMRDTENPSNFAKRLGVHYPLAVATKDLVQKFGGIEGLPTTFLYDRQGALREKVIGFEYTSVFEAALKPLL